MSQPKLLRDLTPASPRPQVWRSLVCLLAFSLFPGIPRALDWQAGAGFRTAALPVPPKGKTGFESLSPMATGIDFTNVLAEERHLTNQILLNGSGVAAGDVDGDGWCDLYFCRMGGPNRLYRNLGQWKFEDITAAAGVACGNLDSTGAAFADLDGDGDLDLIVNSVGGGTHVFFNDGRGHFTEKTKPLNADRGGMSLALADIDGDGYLDLYIANYRTTALMDMPNARFWLKTVNGRQVVATVNGRSVTETDLADRFIVTSNGGIEEQGEVDGLYRNLGGTNFALVSFTQGAFLNEASQPLTRPPLDWGLSVMFRDINQDGLPDIYVCNDFDSPDRIWINQGGGQFQAIPRLALRETSFFSMGVDFADINRDGFDDFVVLDMMSRDHQQRMNFLTGRTAPIPVVGEIGPRPQYPRNTLFLNRGDGTYAEVAQLSGVEAAEWAWCSIFLDVDLDGLEDLLVTNGHERAARDLDVIARLKEMRKAKQMSDTEIFQARKMFPRLAPANLAFRNRRDLTFEEVGAQWGFDFRGVSQGMALADLDNDGDLDLVVNNLNGAAGVYRNESAAPRVAIRLKGKPPNTRGIGARIWVYGGAVPMQSQEMICGGRYLSCDDTIRTFAAGSLTNELRIEIHWRSGRRSIVRGVKGNRIYEIDEARATEEASSKLQAPSSKLQAMFQDVSELLHHTHHEDPFDDFSRQPLLPNRLSQLGPGAAWFDLDGNGHDALIIGSGRGGRLAIYRNDGRGGFLGSEGPDVTRDQTAILGWCPRPGQTTILAGSANYEDGLAVGSPVRQYDSTGKLLEDFLPGTESSTGPLALGDVDGDGNLDLFIGGRVIPGRYPEAASSMMLRNVNGRFEVDLENTKRLAKVGMVSGAVFSDLDGDGAVDLVLACEWGPVRVFRNEGGRLVEITAQIGLAEYRGWWNGVTTGDLDGDGRMDIIASNWGKNTKYESHRTQPLRMYFGDLDGNGSLELVEAFFDAGLNKIVPERTRDVLASGFPFVAERFSTHAAYGAASVQEILGERMNRMIEVTANTLESMVFLNRGTHFEAHPLPTEAQWAPAFGLTVGDYDGDGNEDIFLSQNFFAMQPQTSPYDGGRGLWLKGDGNAGLTPVPGGESGVKVYGEQRGCALGDYDEDGRVDLVVTQNAGPTRLYRNVGGRAGLRVRLKGPPRNPSGVGATMRLRFGQRLGPAREIHSGSGYWSQDSAVQVLGMSESPTEIQVRWPGGKTMASPVPAGAREIEVARDGACKLIR